MGKVLNTFRNGFPGAVSRSADDVILSLRNASGAPVPFGAPVFLVPGENACRAFDAASATSENFLGIAVRIPDKTPDTYPQGQFNDGAGEGEVGCWKAGDVMEVLVRGSVAIPLSATGSPGGNVYIRKSDGKLTATAGSSGSTVLLENVRIRNPRTGWSGCCEAVVNRRNIL
jgi:hypothetical protein